MRLLVFCGDRSAIERFDAAGWPIIVPIFGQTQKAEIIAAFKADPNARLAVDRHMTTGWRAPHDTFVLFDPSWPFNKDDPYTKQAVMRRDIHTDTEIFQMQSRLHRPHLPPTVEILATAEQVDKYMARKIDPDCPACGGSGRMGPFFPGGLSTQCGNCGVRRLPPPEVLSLLRDMDRRDPSRLGAFAEASPARAKALKLGLIVKIRRMKVGHNWLFGLTAAGREIVDGEKL